VLHFAETGGDRMSKKDRYEPHQDPSFNRSHGRQDGEPPKEKAPERERNVGHKDAEEHSRVPKGNRG
jgi:hypothetical protein